MQTILYFILGVGILYAGAEWFVKGSASLSAIFKITPLMIGMVVVSAGTSMPELLVRLMAAIRGNSDISIGNVVGSNIANIALGLGLTSIIFPTKIRKNIVKREMIFMLIASIVFAIVSLNGTIGRLEGVFLLILMVSFVTYSYKTAKKEHIAESLEVIVEDKNLTHSLLWLTLGLTSLLLGSHILISAGIKIALWFGISELIIGISLVAVGTSVPEIATSIVAAYKKEFDISVGNIVGSNIFNILFIIGIVAAIKPLHVSPEVITIHLPVMLMFAIGLLPIMKKNLIINRIDGLLLLASYSIYIGYVYL